MRNSGAQSLRRGRKDIRQLRGSPAHPGNVIKRRSRKSPPLRLVAARRRPARLTCSVFPRLPVLLHRWPGRSRGLRGAPAVISGRVRTSRVDVAWGPPAAFGDARTGRARRGPPPTASACHASNRVPGSGPVSSTDLAVPPQPVFRKTRDREEREHSGKDGPPGFCTGRRGSPGRPAGDGGGLRHPPGPHRHPRASRLSLLGATLREAGLQRGRGADFLSV